MPGKELISALLLFFCATLWAQKNDSITFKKKATDTSVVDTSLYANISFPTPDTTPIVFTKKNKYHSPKKAAMLSAIFPGFGQAYNKKYWKIPIVYLAIGGVGYLAYTNSIAYTFYHNLHIIANNPNLSSIQEKQQLKTYASNNKNLTKITELTADQISNKKEADFKIEDDHYRKNRDLLFFATGLLYLCNILDATVDGHLYNYSVDEDLSFHVQPTIFSYGLQNQSTYGISLSMNF